MRLFTLIAMAATATTMLFAATNSRADENTTHAPVPVAQPPRPISTAGGGSAPIIAPPGQPLHTVPGRVYPNPVISTPGTPCRYATDKSRMTIALARTQIAMVAGTESFVDLDTRLTETTVDHPDRASVEVISEKSLKIKALRPGVTRVILGTSEHGNHTLWLSVIPNTAELEERLKHFRIKRLAVCANDDELHISGIVRSEEDVKKVLDIADEFTAKVTSRLRVENKPSVGDVVQILVECHVVEFQANEGISHEALHKALPMLRQGRSILDDGQRFEDLKKKLSEHGRTKILAAPKLVTTHGRTAKLHIGGEIRIPTKQLGGGFEYMPIGTIVEATPVIVDDDEVRLRINVEVSEISHADPEPIVTDAWESPRVQTLRAESTFDMTLGQSFIMSGPAVVRGQTKPNSDSDGKTKRGPTTYPIFVIRTERVALTDPTSDAAPAVTASEATDEARR